MNRSTLPRHARAHAPGWAHPYPAGLWSPLFYADGDDGQDDDSDDDDGSGDDDAGSGDSDDQDDDTGSGDDDQDGDGDGDDADPEGADQLGDKGKRALASMKGKWRSERDKRRDLERQLSQKNQGNGDDAVAKATAAATATANTRIVKAEIRAAAAKKLADPRDALRFLDLEQFEVGSDGEVDADEIADAIEDLISSKPYLAAAPAKPRFQGTGDGGAARKAGRPKQLTDRDLKNMSAEQIVKAQDEGKLDDLLGG